MMIDVWLDFKHGNVLVQLNRQTSSLKIPLKRQWGLSGWGRGIVCNHDKKIAVDVIDFIGRYFSVISICVAKVFEPQIANLHGLFFSDDFFSKILSL